MAKTIEDYIDSISELDMGVQVVIHINHPPEYQRVKHLYHIYPDMPEFARFRALAQQVKRALGFDGLFEQVDIQESKDFRYEGMLELQLSYKHCKKLV